MRPVYLAQDQPGHLRGSEDTSKIHEGTQPSAHYKTETPKDILQEAFAFEERFSQTEDA